MLSDWIRTHLPDAFHAMGPLGVLWWQWAGLLLLVPVSAVVGFLLDWPTRALFRRVVRHTKNAVDDALVERSQGPVVLFWSVVASSLLVRWLDLTGEATALVANVQQALAITAVFWLLIRIVKQLEEILPRVVDLNAHPAWRSMIPLTGSVMRLALVAMGTLAVIAAFGYSVTTVLAGLGIGGIAVALGAQKSLEHFFGSLSIGVDRPFRIGDWVLVNGVEGEVEEIGLRSTRIRTIERTIVTIPNGKLAESQTENFGARERIRLRTVIGLEYDTSVTTMTAVRDDIEALIRTHPMTWPGRVVVRFYNFASSSLEIEIFSWVQTANADEFRAVREEIFLGIIGVVERHGAKFAFPSQTVYPDKS